MTKAALQSFTRGLARELGPRDITVNLVQPGPTATEFLDVSKTHSGLFVRKMPMLSPEEVVAVSLRGLDRGKLRVIPGFANWVVDPLVRVAVEDPQPRQRRRQPAPTLRLGGREAPDEGGTEVVVLGLQPLQPGVLVGQVELGLGLLREGEEVVEVAVVAGCRSCGTPCILERPESMPSDLGRAVVGGFVHETSISLGAAPRATPG